MLRLPQKVELDFGLVSLLVIPMKYKSISYIKKICDP